MPFFQNPFDQEFRGTWILGDRQYTVNFNLKGNPNSSVLMVNWVPEPYDLTGNQNLTIFYAIDPTLRQFASLTIDVSGTTIGATMATEVASKLNANPTFAGLWVASVQPQYSKTLGSAPNIVAIRSKRQNTLIRAYVDYTGAESILRFNLKAPIAELPNYFARHTIANKDVFPDGVSLLVQLDPTNNYQAALIDSQGLDHTIVQGDYALLHGRSGLFPFKKFTYDGSNRVTSLLEYPAGAKAGDLSSLTKYGYISASTNPSVVTVEPYTLTSGDLVVPPF